MKQRVQSSTMIIVVVLTMIIITGSHQLEPSRFLNARFHCDTSDEYRVTYFMNHFLGKGQIVLRSLNTTTTTTTSNNNVTMIVSFTSNETLSITYTSLNETVIIEYLNQTIITTNNKKNNGTTLLLQMNDFAITRAVSLQRKDAYLKRKLQYYELDINHVNSSSSDVDFQSIQIITNNDNRILITTTTTTTTTTSEEQCTDYSDHNVMYYHYFQPAYSLATVIVSSVLVVMTLIILLFQIGLSGYKLVSSRLLSEIPCNITLGVGDFVLLIGYSIDLYFMRRYGARSQTVLLMISYIRMWCGYLTAVCYVLNCLRYLYMLNFYRLMKQGKQTFRLQRFVTSKLFYSLVLTVLGLIVLGILFVIGSLVGLTQVFLGSLMASAITTLACAVTFIVCLISIIVEFIANRSVVKKHGIWFYFTQDPFLMRLQAMLIFPALVVGVPYGAINAILDANYTSIGLTRVRVIVYALLYFTFSLVMRVLMGGIFVCSIQFWKCITCRYSDKNSNSNSSSGDNHQDSEYEFEQLMKDAECAEMFMEYCKMEFSLENVLCWKHIQQLKGKTSEYSQVVDFADTYIKPYSPLQINLPSGTIKKFMQRLGGMDSTSHADESMEEIMRIVEVDLLANLSDTRSRFVLSDEFKKWNETRRRAKELVETNF